MPDSNIRSRSTKFIVANGQIFTPVVINTLGMVGYLPPPLPLPPTSQEDLWLDGHLDDPHAAKALYIYKYSCLPRDSNLGPTAPQSPSLTTTPDGRLHIKNLFPISTFDI
ncbi:hypothetical protein TNCV_4209421 [Trichonephila clavipes]|nr:hypothetical protein TNCV_4209421 [Trichonephila clavipes]